MKLFIRLITSIVLAWQTGAAALVEPASTEPADALGVVLTRLGPWPASGSRVSRRENSWHEASSDGCHCAVVARDASKETQTVFYDGQAQRPFYQVLSLAVTSAGGGHFAFAGCSVRSTLVLDGKLGPQYDAIRAPLPGFFSADGAHLAYAAARGGKWFLVSDGRPGPAYDKASGDNPIRAAAFSPDGQRLAYSVKTADGWFVVDGGKPGPLYGRTIHDADVTPVFSPDGKHLAFAAAERKLHPKEFIVSDGRLGPSFKMVWPPLFSADGSHLAYVAEDQDCCVMLDGKPGPAFHLVEALTMSPDGTRMAYCAETNSPGYRRVMVVDGVAGPRYMTVRWPVFSPDGKHLAYIAARGRTWFVVLDGQPGPSYTDQPAGAPVFSPDGRHFAYGVLQPAQGFVVIDGKPGPEFEYITSSLKFSPNSRHFAYIAKKNWNSWVLVVDGHTGPSFDEIVPNGPAFHGDRAVEYLAVRDGFLFRVKAPI